MSLLYLNQKRSHHITNEKNLVAGDKVYELFLPNACIMLYEITIFNLSGHNIFIKTTVNDKIYSQLYAPLGKKEILIENNRKVKCTFMRKSPNSITGRWYIEIA
jgi:hypothetical protein